MAHRLRWRQLSIGIIALAAIVGAALAILTFGRVGTLRGKKFRLYVATRCGARCDPRQRSLARRTESWVGQIRCVSPATAPPKERLILALDVLEKDQPKLRLDTRVQVRPGANILGDRVVYLGMGRSTRGRSSTATRCAPSNRTTWRSSRRKPRSRRANFPASSRT